MHPGLPWAGCTILAAPAKVLLELRRKVVAAGDVTVCDVPASAQTNQVFAEHLDELAATPTAPLQLRALSLFVPRTASPSSPDTLGLLQ